MTSRTCILVAKVGSFLSRIFASFIKEITAYITYKKGVAANGGLSHRKWIRGGEDYNP